MLLFLVRGDPAFSLLQPAREWNSRGGVRAEQPWAEVEFELLERRDEFIAADCLMMNTGADGFLVSEFAREAIAPSLVEAGEFLPVRVMGQAYWWLNCVASMEALDRAGTDAEWSKVEGEWGSFSWISTTRRLEFRRETLRGAPALFRIPEYPQGVLFAREEFRELVQRHELTGFRFDLVWSSEDGGVFDPGGLGFKGIFDPAIAGEIEARREAARETIRRRARK